MAQLVLSTEGDDVVGNSVELDELDLPSTAPKMLIADDDPTVVRALADRCTRMGFDVETATNGMQAMLKASRSKPDILLVDVSMPEVDGFSVCAHLLDPTRKTAPCGGGDGKSRLRGNRALRRLWRVLCP